MSGTQIGAIVGIAFGCAWGIAGGTALTSMWRPLAIFGSMIVSVVLAVAISYAAGKTRNEGYFDGHIYGIAVMLEVVAIIVAAIVLNRSHHPTLIPPVVAAIVGLHFVGLWRATNNTVFVWLAAALCVVGLVGCLVPRPARMPVAGIGSAISLWASAASGLLR